MTNAFAVAPMPPVDAAAPQVLSGEAMSELLAKSPDFWEIADVENLILTFRSARAHFAQQKAVEEAGGKKVRTSRASKTQSLASPDMIAEAAKLIDLDL